MSENNSRLARLVGTKRGPIFESVFIAAIAVCLALGVQAWALKPYQIPSSSMEPTLDVGQRVLVNRLTERLGGEPEIGDVVVFHPPLNAVPDEQPPGDQLPECGVQATLRRPGQPCPQPGPQEADASFIKRVVAGPGDRLKVVNGIPIVDGEAVEGDWQIIPCRRADSCNYRREITIPDDHYFMMGDNRPNSDDSRFWGPVPSDWIVGEAFATYWPPDRIGTL